MIAIARHRWVRVSTGARAAVAASCADEALRAEVAAWLALDQPLVARARQPGEQPHLQSVGLCLPTARGGHRVALSIAPAGVSQVEHPVPMHKVQAVLREECRALARVLSEGASALGFELRVFGSAAWQWRTGECYLHASSDLDLLAAPPDARALQEWLALLARLDSQAAMRLDGEIECPGGDAVNWRELAAGAASVLVKSCGRARLEPAARMWQRFR